MARLRCSNCNYSFEPKARAPTRCPYCSAEGTITEEKSILDSLDEDIEE